MFWRRSDGELVRDLPPTKGIVPYLMRGRNESAVYFEQHVAMRHADAYIREFNVAHPDTPITIQHLLMWAIAQILEQFPTMNRFVVGGRLYQRTDIWFTYSAKQSLKGKSPLIVIKRRFDPAEPFVDMVRDMQRPAPRGPLRRPHGAVRPGSRAHPEVPGGRAPADPGGRADGRRVRPAPGVDDRARPAVRQCVLRQPRVASAWTPATTTSTSTAASASSA